MTTDAPQDLSALARMLGLPGDAGEAAIVAAIAAQEGPLVRRALRLPEDAAVGACLAEIRALQADRAALIARLSSDLSAVQEALRAARVRDLIQDAMIGARDALDP